MCIDKWQALSEKAIKGELIESVLGFVIFLLISVIIYLFNFHEIINYLIISMSVGMSLHFVFSLLRIKKMYLSRAFKCSGKFVVFREGIYIKTRVFIPCEKIYQIRIKKGPILRKLNLVSLELVTAAESLEIPYIESKTAEEIKAYIEANGGETVNE